MFKKGLFVAVCFNLLLNANLAWAGRKTNNVSLIEQQRKSEYELWKKNRKKDDVSWAIEPRGLTYLKPGLSTTLMALLLLSVNINEAYARLDGEPYKRLTPKDSQLGTIEPALSLSIPPSSAPVNRIDGAIDLVASCSLAENQKKIDELQKLLNVHEYQSLQEYKEAGIDINGPNSQGKPLLSWAASYNFIKIVNALILADANPNAVDQNGDTPIFHAFGQPMLELFDALILAKADVNAVDHWGWTPIMHAGAFHHLEILNRLILAGADINVGGEVFAQVIRHSKFFPSDYFEVAKTLLLHPDFDFTLFDKAQGEDILKAIRKNELLDPRWASLGDFFEDQTGLGLNFTKYAREGGRLGPAHELLFKLSDE